MSIFYMEDTYMFNSHIVVLSHSFEEAREMYLQKNYGGSTFTTALMQAIVLRNQFSIDAPAVVLNVNE